MNTSQNLPTQSATKEFYDLILMDLHMPILDGFKTAQRLREQVRDGTLDLSHTVIVALSAMTQNQYQDCMNETQGSLRLFDAYMEKPINSNSLRAILRQGK